MKPDNKFFDSSKLKTEVKSPEDVTLYGRGAGLYSYLNVLAEKLAVPSFDRQLFKIKQ